MLGLGHMLPMLSSLASGVPFETLMLKWRRQYGPFFQFQLPNNPTVVVVSDPEAIKEVNHGGSSGGGDGQLAATLCCTASAASGTSCDHN